MEPEVAKIVFFSALAKILLKLSITCRFKCGPDLPPTNFHGVPEGGWLNPRQIKHWVKKVWSSMLCGCDWSFGCSWPGLVIWMQLTQLDGNNQHLHVILYPSECRWLLSKPAPSMSPSTWTRLLLWTNYIDCIVTM